MPKTAKPYDADDEEEEEVERVGGPCRDCQFFDIDRADEDVPEDTVAPCLHPDLEDYQLTVSGDSGCNLFETYEEEEEDEDEDEEEEEEEEEEEY